MSALPETAESGWRTEPPPDPADRIKGFVCGAKRCDAVPSPVERDDGIEWGGRLGARPGGPGGFLALGETLGVRTLAYADAEAGDALVILTNGNAGMSVAGEIFRAATRSGWAHF